MTSTTKKIRSVDILIDAWDRLSGSKMSILIMIICIGCISLLVNILFSYLTTASPIPTTLPKSTNPWLDFFLFPLISNACIAPFVAASIMLGVKKNRGDDIHLFTGFSLLSSFINLILTALIMSAIVNIVIAGTIWFVGQTQLSVGYRRTLQFLTLLYSLIVYAYLILALPSVIDKKLSCFKAISFSVSRMKHYFFKAIILIIVTYAFIFVSLIPATIGFMLAHQYALILGWGTTGLILIWLIPYAVMIQGTLYHKVVDDTESKPKKATLF